MSSNKNQNQTPTPQPGTGQRVPLREDTSVSNDYGRRQKSYDVANSMPPPKRPGGGGNSDGGGQNQG